MNYKTDIVKELTGHEPNKLENFIHEYREYWER
jgi:hypothetical protein